MSKKYIPINTIEDIDLSKISLATINNRYIDSNGNRFATRFNLRSRKIQIVRIALGADEAINAKGKVVKELLKKRMHHEEDDSLLEELIPQSAPEEPEEEKPPEDPAYADLPDWIREKEIPFLDEVDPAKFISSLPETNKTISERIFGIIHNIEKSGLYDSFQGFDPVLEFSHLFDVEINPAAQKTDEMISEFSKFPKTPEHYMNEVETRFHNKLDTIEGEEKMNYLKSYIICHSYFPAMKGAMQITELFHQIIATIDPESIPEDKKRTFNDTLGSADSLTEVAREKISEMITWMRQEGVY